MKKKLVVLLSGIVMAAALTGCGGASSSDEGKISLKDAKTDSISKASTKVFYEKGSLTGQALVDSINKREGSVTIATTNPDGSPNLAVAVPGAINDKYLVMGLAPNQTLENFKNHKIGVISYYIYNPAAQEKNDRNKGARLVVKMVEDKDTKEKLKKEAGEKANDNSLFLEIVEVKPLG
ncbi:hypothetical protein [Clostridium polynesiense]|uniref:hypothetical protein n=1 Tax=Clostridium polynesiense TaxID=1325933 RepID=UPI00058E5FA2|nr:hypothetical protein [Clostridium polynesiense]